MISNAQYGAGAVVLVGLLIGLTSLWLLTGDGLAQDTRLEPAPNGRPWNGDPASSRTFWLVSSGPYADVYFPPDKVRWAGTLERDQVTREERSIEPDGYDGCASDVVQDIEVDAGSSREVSVTAAVAHATVDRTLRAVVHDQSGVVRASATSAVPGGGSGSHEVVLDDGIRPSGDYTLSVGWDGQPEALARHADFRAGHAASVRPEPEVDLTGMIRVRLHRNQGIALAPCRGQAEGGAFDIVLVAPDGSQVRRYAGVALGPVVIEPTAVLTPTATPIPTRVPAGEVRIRLAERYDSITGRADADYQAEDATDKFGEDDFGGHGAIASATNVLTIPACIRVGPGASGGHDPDHGYPWTRYAIAWLASGPAPAHVLSGGFDIQSAFVVQTEDDSYNPGNRVNKVLEIDTVEYHLMVSRDRLDCRLYEGRTWSLHN